MPEGHTVHRLAHAFPELFGGQRLAVSSPQGRFAAGAAVLDGSRLVRADAHGKQLFLGFAAPAAAGTGGDGTAGDGARAADDDAGVPDDALRWLRVHLGLYGSWTFAGDRTFSGEHAIGAPRRRVGEEETALPGSTAEVPDWLPPEPRGAVRVRLLGEHGVADLTGPTACEVVTAAEKAAVHARLGPDPLRPDGDVETFVQAVRARRRPVGELLMDQAVIAGVGNVYRAEVLYRARLHPRRLGRDVPARRLRELWADTAALMADGVAVGRILTTRPEHRAGGEEPHYVYRRTGLPCLVCGATVVDADMAGRRAYWCPRCQRAPRPVG